MNCITSNPCKQVIGLQPKRVFFQKLFLILLLLCSWQIAEAAPALSRSPVVGPPTVKVTVSGSGFSAYEAVDVYFDTEDLCLSATDDNGAFSCTLKVPKEALPGRHWLSAVGRKSGLAAKKSFLVRVNWSQIHYGPQKRGYNPYENVLSSANVADLKKAWSYSTTGGFLRCSPVVANGVVYVGGGYYDKNLYALDAMTGVKKWSYFTGSEIIASPAVANGLVYVCSADGNLYALDARTGVLKWSYPTGGTYSSPAVANGVVYVGSWDYNLYALDAMTGGKKWSYPTGSYIHSSPAVANGVVYVGSADKNLYALDAMTGVKKWSYSAETDFRSSPAVANGLVYAGSYNSLYALDAMTGALKWSYYTGSFRDPITSSPAVANGLVYVGAWEYNLLNLHALDAMTGVKKWSYSAGGKIDSSPAVANGVVYVVSYLNLYALDAMTGVKKWSYKTGGVTSPAVANGLVYVGSYDGKLYCFGRDPVLPGGGQRDGLRGLK